MKITMLILSLMISFPTWASHYGCNIQMMPEGVTIKAEETNKFIKEFDVKLPVKNKQEYSFKSTKIEVFPTTGKEVTVAISDEKTKSQAKASFSIGKEVLNLSLNGSEFICWPDVAMRNAKDKKSSL